jgi:acetolactate synthase-1/2/3 large subunit
MKIKLTDFIEQYLVSAGIHQVFMVTGGGAMHLNQSLGNSNSLRTVFNHHEQACAMGAESYYRSSNKIAVVNVTTGPGGTNAITGIYGAWTDSIGMLVISGQVKWETTVQSTDLPLRQLGDQEINIVQLVTPITKYAVTVTDPLSIKYHLDKALYLAANGRPGPVWLDIPMDVQGAVVNTNELSSFDPSELKIDQVEIDLSKVATEVVQRIAKSERPVIMVGTGIRLSQQRDNLVRLVEKLNIPVVTAWNAHDIIWTDHPLYIGRPGTIGDRAGNFAVQNADLLLILGCRLNIRQISYEWKSFARAAYKIWADIDLAELQKPTIKPDLPINCNLAHLVPQLLSNANTLSSGKHDDWIRWCNEERVDIPPTFQNMNPLAP